MYSYGKCVFCTYIPLVFILVIVFFFTDYNQLSTQMPPKKSNSRKTKLSPTNNTVRTPTKKSSKIKHPSTPSTVSTNVSGASSIKSYKSSGTTKSIEGVYKKLNVGDVDTDDDVKEEDDDDDDDDVTAFDVRDIKFESLRSLVNAANHMFTLAQRQELAGASHREYVTAILETQTLTVCKQLYQLVAVKLGNKTFKQTMREVSQLGNQSKPIIVNQIMHHVNRYNRQNNFTIEAKTERNNYDDEIKLDSEPDVNDEVEVESSEDEEEADFEDTKEAESEEEDDEEELEIQIDTEEDSDEEDEDIATNKINRYKEKEQKVAKKGGIKSSKNDDGQAKAGTGKLNKKKPALKTPEDEDNDSDIDPFGEEVVFSAALIKSNAIRESGGMSFHISPGIKVIGSNKTIYVAIFDLSGQAFFLKPEYIKLGMEHMKKTKSLFSNNHIDPEMKWIGTMKICPRRIAHSVSDEIMRTNKGNAQQVIYFVMELGNSKKSPSLKDFVDSVKKDFKKCFKIYPNSKSGGCGKTLLKFLEDIGNKGLHPFLLKKYSDGVNLDQAADSITAIFDSVFNDPGLKTFWNVNLDKFLPNFEIKQVLTNYAHVSGWDDLPSSDKEACFYNAAKDMSRLPAWNSMVRVQEY